jgi:RHS repeat-associated protein
MYTIPIETPPGINGMQPSVSISYHSQSRNGLLGFAWNLSAYSAISRTGKTFYHDGSASAPDLSTSDNLMLDGQRLILTSTNGTNLTNNAKYSTEIETYSDITYKSIGGKLCFEVKTKDGKTLQYGTTTDSYIEASSSNSTALCWLLSKVSDSNGNYMTYHYTKNTATGEFYLQRIEYAGNASANISPACAVKFVYATRADGEKGYYANSLVSSNVILEKIKITSAGAIVKEYQFNYLYEGIYSKLTEVIETGVDGSRYNATSIVWGNESTSSSEYTTVVDNSSHPSTTWRPLYADFNGDGKTDFLYYQLKNSYSDYKGQDNATLYLSTGNSFSKKNITIALQANFYGFLLGDFNGDGLTDVIQICRSSSSSYTFYFYLFNGSSFTISGSFTSGSPVAYVGDFDGDGKDEVFTKEEKKIFRRPDTGNVTSTQTTGMDSTSLVLTGPYINRQFTIDFNGNGKTDIMMVYSDSCKVFELNGSAWQTIIRSDELKNQYNFYMQPGDFNGDGKTDVLVKKYTSSTVYEYYLLISKGNKFEKKDLSDLGITGEVTVGDFNGDGKTDLVWSNGFGVNLFPLTLGISTGGSFKTTTYTSANIPNAEQNWQYLHFADFNGNGRTSMCYDSDPNGYVRKSFLSGEPLAVERVVDGLNRDIFFKYSYISDGIDYSETGSISSVFPVVKYAPLKVVASIETSEGQIFNTYRINTKKSYKYKDLRVHKQGKGLLCFGEIHEETSYAPAEPSGLDPYEYYTTTSKYDYHSTYFYPYLKEEKKFGGGSHISLIPVSTRKDTLKYWNYGSGRIFPYMSSQTITDEQTGITARTVISDMNDGNYGNPATVTTTKGNLTETATFVYGSFGSWCNNKPTSVTVVKKLNGGDTQTRSSTYIYDNNGNLTEETVDPSDTNKRVTEYKDYTPFGQPQTITVTANGKSRTSTFTYKPSSGRFLESTTNGLGETVTYNWNESRGVLASKSDRIGTTSYQYDGMNRLIKTTYPDGVQKSNTLQWAPSANSKKLYYATSQVSGASPVNIFYNSFGQEVLRETYGFNNQKISIFTKHEAYKKSISKPIFGSSPSVWETVYENDKLGRISKVTTPGGVTNYEYTGNKTTVSSPADVRKTILNTEGWVATSTVNDKTVTFTYYPTGQVKTSTPEGNTGTVTTVYDLQGNRTTLSDPDAGEITSKYNGFGDLLWTEQRVHLPLPGTLIRTDYGYKDNGLPETITRKGETTTYAYDSKNRISSIEIAGQHKQTFTYGNFDRITNVEEKIGGTETFNTGTTYDSYGRVKYETFPSGYYTENVYDNNGILTGVKDPNGNFIWELKDENERGQLKQEKKGSKTVDYGYDNYGFLSSISSPGIIDMSFDFGQDGNLNSRTDLLTNQSEWFGYDSNNRLTSWDIYRNNTLTGNSISYNSVTGNIQSKSDVGYTDMQYGANGKPHALTSLIPPSSSPIPSLTTTYTDFSKIKTLTEGSKSYTVTYGVDRQRRSTVYKEGSTVKLTRYYIGNYEEEKNSSGNIRKIHYLRGGGIFIRNNEQDTLLYTYADHLGSLTVLTNHADFTENYAYDPWGARRNPGNWTLRDLRPSWRLNRGFTGHEHIDVFGIINMNGRVYDPLTAQFFSPDPHIQAPGNWLNYNRYSYCLNNPLIYTDPTGEKLWHWLLGVAFFLDPVSATTMAMITIPMAAGTAQSIDFGVTYFGTMFKQDPLWGGRRGYNSSKIVGGMFQTDENRGFWGNAGMLLSRWTWESPQTMAGLGYSHFRNFTGNVDRVDYLGGATFITNENAGKRNGITLGNYININIKDKITGSFKDWVLSDPLYMHEYGHTIDSRRFGLSYLLAIGVPSVISADKNEPINNPPFDTHGSYWTEVRANQNAKGYFSKYYSVDWNSPYRGREERIDEDGNLYWYYFTIEDWYPTR